MLFLISGGRGQLGRALKKNLNKQAINPGREEMDICSLGDVEKIFKIYNPDILIHTAALTDVARCEKNPHLAYKINVEGTYNLARVCKRQDIPMVYISTDFVFGGTKTNPYSELDQPGPLNIYGKSKLKGEEVVKTMGGPFFIIRTSWLYGDGEKSFPVKIKKALQNGNKVYLPPWEKGSPTYVPHLASKLIEVIRTGKFGLYHLASRGVASRFEWGQRIGPVQKSPRSYSFDGVQRPRYTPLISYRLQNIGVSSLPTWEEGFEEFCLD